MKKIIIQALLDILNLFLTSTGLSFTSQQCRKLLHSASALSFDIIIVPGIPFKNNKWDMVMKGRIYWAKYLFDEGIAKNIMFSGAAVHSPWVESKIMTLYAEAIGIPASHIFIEDKAEHSTENVFFSYTKALEMGFSKIAVASDPFQTKLLRKFIHTKVSKEIYLLPIVYGILRQNEKNYIDPNIDAQQAFIPEFKALRHRETFRERFRGTRGNNIEELSK